MELITFEDLPSTNTPLNAENLNNNFEVVKDGVDRLRGTLIWTNPTPSASFPEQDITMDLTDYYKFEILFMNNNEHFVSTAYKNYATRCNTTGYDGSIGDNTFIRTITFTNSKINISNAGAYGVGSNSTFTPNCNNNIKPIKIYGYK